MSGCKTVETTADVVGFVGKTGWKATKLTAKAAYHTTKATSKGIKTVVYMTKGKQIIPLEKKGNSYYVKVKLNRKMTGRFLLDTGASNMQISRAMARRLNINLRKGDPTLASIANGQIISGKNVTLKEVRLGRVRLRNIEAIVLDYDNMDLQDGLLGMSFLNHFIFEINTQTSELILKRRIN